MPGMPGMKMPKGQKKMAAPSGVPGHAEVMIPAEIQQRIGVTVGQVVKSPLRMSVDTVGIVGFDEPKVSHVHLKTEGWVEQLFVNYLRQKGVGDKSPKLILLEVKTENLVIIANDGHIGLFFSSCERTT